LPADEPLGALEPVAYFNGAMQTGVTVSQQGRIFVNFPRWGDEVPFTVSEIRDGEAVAYPNEVINQADQNDPAAGLVSVQSVVVDPAYRLWILDTGSPMFKPTEYGAVASPGALSQRERSATETLHTLPRPRRLPACPAAVNDLNHFAEQRSQKFYMHLALRYRQVED
jgi:hypothetical protein